MDYAPVLRYHYDFLVTGISGLWAHLKGPAYIISLGEDRRTNEERLAINKELEAIFKKYSLDGAKLSEKQTKQFLGITDIPLDELRNWV